MYVCGPTQARLYGGTYNGDIVFDARPVQAQLSLNEHLHGTDIGALVKAAFDSARGFQVAQMPTWRLRGVGNTDDAIKPLIEREDRRKCGNRAP